MQALTGHILGADKAANKQGGEGRLTAWLSITEDTSYLHQLPTKDDLSHYTERTPQTKTREPVSGGDSARTLICLLAMSLGQGQEV